VLTHGILDLPDRDVRGDELEVRIEVDELPEADRDEILELGRDHGDHRAHGRPF
jgi:hypothetical protein